MLIGNNARPFRQFLYPLTLLLLLSAILYGRPVPVSAQGGAGTITGVVYRDFNQNQVRDGSETGIEGVTITLYNNAGVVIGTDTTDADGVYAFTSLPAGAYTIVETDPDDYVSTTPNTVERTLGINETIVVNFGDIRKDSTTTPGSGCIRGFVFEDSNGNGLPDPGESGIPGVIVTLYDTSDNEVATTTTDANGLYGFCDIAEGRYRITVEGQGVTPRSEFMDVVEGQVTYSNFSDRVVAQLYAPLIANQSVAAR